MAFYTPPSLPRTPSECTMHATLPSLSTDLLNSWSLCRQPKQDAPLTPPMTSTFESRTMPRSKPRLTLPPIAQLDRQLSSMPPLTPPADVVIPAKYPPPSQHLPPISPIPDEASDTSCSDDSEMRPPEPSEPFHYVDWLDATRTRSSQFIAEKTCEMICYLWFATPTPVEQSYSSPTNSPPFMTRSTPPAPLQLAVTPTFVQFLRKLLETTQVSQSVIVLSLHYIFRLREKNRFTPAQPGSEFRIAVAGLMMANKFLDDNTYTNKTWSEVSGIELPEINKMEREFLLGVDFNLYVDKPTYESWLNLLKGLVMTKERDSRYFRKSRGLGRSGRLAHAQGSAGPVARTYTSKTRVQSHRARSTSPTRTVPTSLPQPCCIPPSATAVTLSPTPRPGSKRSAAAAFSPTSASFSHVPSKRPVSMISLQIPPNYRPELSGPHSHSPLESLQSFANMSIDSPETVQPPRDGRSRRQQWVSDARDMVPETLITAYSEDESRRVPPPQNLYFYTLACSPMENEEETRRRKGRLRYHQPPPPSAEVMMPSSSTSSASSSRAPSSSCSCYHPHSQSHPHLPQLQNSSSHHAYPISQPMRMHIPVVQSATTSPHEMHVNFTSRNYNQTSLPHFHEMNWSRPPIAATQSSSSTLTSYDTYAQQQQTQTHQSQTQKPTSGKSPVPSAPFANAGPPGVHFYPTPVQRTYSIYPQNGWSSSSRTRRA
ncbi:hypothetical protein AMATHDRAFT_51008 [Amanita thiersii Skay4041]|uniref:Cyclin-like domain-containing protein n=1 Tax=Amanita thiersii Skay4041 TaxID=703135 RepID=A0A2A9NFE2_9AGAR|nr:hypothetical protein AMATHDRAFT_51008 [Amanita thiersii Skay4041]